jgi:hypothetical protein
MANDTLGQHPADGADAARGTANQDAGGAPPGHPTPPDAVQPPPARSPLLVVLNLLDIVVRIIDIALHL